jgi:uncharacterized membrane protein required for colicin V production
MKLPINWFDVFLLVVMASGIAYGRKRGLSETLIPMVRAIAILVAATFLYRPFGQFIVSISNFSLLFCRVAAYILLMIFVWLICIVLRRALGGKLIGSDVFGKGEYYLGMPAGLITFACFTMCGLAILNARLFTEKEIKATQAYVKDVYGSDFFPGLYAAQQSVFVESFTGPYIEKYVSVMLITPTPSEVKAFKQREYEFPGGR